MFTTVITVDFGLWRLSFNSYTQRMVWCVCIVLVKGAQRSMIFMQNRTVFEIGIVRLLAAIILIIYAELSNGFSLICIDNLICSENTVALKLKKYHHYMGHNFEVLYSSTVRIVEKASKSARKYRCHLTLSNILSRYLFLVIFDNFRNVR